MVIMRKYDTNGLTVYVQLCVSPSDCEIHQRFVCFRYKTRDVCVLKIQNTKLVSNINRNGKYKLLLKYPFKTGYTAFAYATITKQLQNNYLTCSQSLPYIISYVYKTHRSRVSNLLNVFRNLPINCVH